MHKNGKITAPVSINDVRVTIGNSSHDLGTLCTSNNINKYSRYKPYNRGILTDDILEDRVTPINYGEMDKPKYWNYDMTPKQVSFATNPPNKEDCVWGQPTKATNYRLLDFQNYNHYAKTHIKNIEFFNSVNDVGSEGRTIPFIYDGNAGYYDISYNCRITLNPKADIKINDCFYTNWDFQNMYFLFFLSANVNGIHTEEITSANLHLYAVSEEPISAYKDYSQIFLSIPTYTENNQIKEYYETYIQGNDNGWITGVCLVSKDADGNVDWNSLVSPLMWDGEENDMNFFIYSTDQWHIFDNTYLPKTPVNGDWWISKTSAENEGGMVIQKDNTTYKLAFDEFFNLNITSGSVGTILTFVYNIVEPNTMELLDAGVIKEENSENNPYTIPVGSPIVINNADMSTYWSTINITDQYGNIPPQVDIYMIPTLNGGNPINNLQTKIYSINTENI